MLNALSPELALSALSVALSLGGFVHVIFCLRQTPQRQVLLLATVLAFLTVLAGASTYSWLIHDRMVNAAARAIVQRLPPENVVTIDDLYVAMYPRVDFPILTEALEQLVIDGAVRDKLEPVSLGATSVVQVRIYFQ